MNARVCVPRSDRFINTTAEGIVQAKTGTMTGVNSLSGYVDHSLAADLRASTFPLTLFSIIVNDATVTSTAVRPIIDAIVVLLSQLSQC
jgi:D-alanyl-D-alanine carboxypeptidase/D-alanyl-D-alanine-endopeptidase (penicillin-binding protein 4)